MDGAIYIPLVQTVFQCWINIQPLELVQVLEHPRHQDRYLVIAQISKREKMSLEGYLKMMLHDYVHKPITLFSVAFIAQLSTVK